MLLPEGQVQDLPQVNRSKLHARIDSSSDRAAVWVPRLMIKPFEELFRAVVRQVLGRSEVEPRIELVDDTTILLDGVGADSEGLLHGRVE